jgi:hypothetical protein
LLGDSDPARRPHMSPSQRPDDRPTTVVVEFDVTRGRLRPLDHHVIEIVLDRWDSTIKHVRHQVGPRRCRVRSPVG